MNDNKTTERKPSVAVSLLPIVFLIAELAAVVRIFGSDALEGASQVALIIAAAFAIALSLISSKDSWTRIEDALLESMKSVSTSIVILLLIGAIAGSWMVSGVVPLMIYYGTKILSPAIFLLAVCVICAIVSIMTGSSWTTIATIGVACTGIGMMMGFSPGWTAGAIISGAYFGDKVSPLSDTTVLASSAAGTPLFEHIRYMLRTTIPSFAITCVIFLVASLLYKNPAPQETNSFAMALKSTFNLSPWLLIIPVATGVMIAKRVPALLTLMTSAMLAGIAALIFQPGIVASVAGAESLDFTSAFKGISITYYGSTAIQTGFTELDDLIQTNGMTGMLNTIFLIIAAATFGGAMTGSGMIRSITEFLVKKIHSRVGSVTSTVMTGIFCNMMTGDQYLSILLTGSLYKEMYERNGLKPRLLSRSTEDSATVTSVLIPWNSCGMTQSTVLKVATLEYLPFCFFNLLSPIMSIFVAMLSARRKD